MTEVEPLASEWLWDGDEKSSDAFRDFLSRDTPEVFLSRNILVRKRDWITM
jgi:hypothetical protein